MTESALPASMVQIEISTPGGPDVLVPRQAALPRPAKGELLVRVHAAGVNRPDVIQRQGHYPMPPGASPIPGLEIAGEVVALGADAGSFSVGDKVCALTNGGGYAEYCVVPAGQTLPIPNGMGMVEAAAVPETFFTVWANLFQIGKAQKGETVLIQGGTSGIGTTALMLCREFGLHTIATAGSEDKCAAIRALGGEAINYRDEDFAVAVKARTSGRGADLILDIMGASYFDKNLEALASDGRLVIIGFLGGASVERMNLLTILSKRATVTGSLLRARTASQKADIAASLLEHVWPALAAGRCRPLIDSVYPLANAANAHRRLDAGDHVGKVVLTTTA